MLLNPSKCFFICLGSKSEIKAFILEDRTRIPLTWPQHWVLGITIDKKVANKLSALPRIVPYLSKKQINLLYNSFFKGQLSYCPLFWTFCSKFQTI